MITLLLVRHGETEENLAQVMQGQSRGTLSELGKEQATRLARRLKTESIDLILSSDLDRAAQTTKAIAAFHSCEVRFLPALRERSSGIFEGRSNIEYREATRNCGIAPEQFKPDGGESITELYARSISVLDELLTHPSHSTILVSTHSGVTNCLICHLLGKPLSDFWSIEQKNTCVNRFEFSACGALQRSHLNCVQHLSA